MKKFFKLYKESKKNNTYKISFFMKANIFFCLLMGFMIGYAAPDFIADGNWGSLAVMLFATAVILYGAISSVKSEIIEYRFKELCKREELLKEKFKK